MTAAQILHRHDDAVRALHAYPPQSLVLTGDLSGLGLLGTFSSWKQGDDERRDDSLGARTQRELRLGGREFLENADGDVRELRGLLLRESRTEDMVESPDLARHLSDVTALGLARLDDGRSVWQVRVALTGGQPFVVSFDAKTWMIDQESYVEGDGTQSITYDDYRVIDGALVPFVEVDSIGDHSYDITSRVRSVRVDVPVDPSIFAMFASPVISAAVPVTVHVREHDGLLFAPVSIHGKTFTFLIDTGAQSVIVDPETALTLGLEPQGRLEVSGAQRTAAQGVGALDGIDIGGAHLPLHVASVVDLSGIVDSTIPIDGIVGYPLFAAAEVRIDPDDDELTLAKPGSLPVRGVRLPVETDRAMPEVRAKLDGIEGQFIVDTGDANELLIFRAFANAHPMVSEFDLGPFRLYNRYASVVLANAGAFADRDDAGNVGHGILANFVTTFDLANGALYLDKARRFDDGRYRPVVEPLMRR